MTKIKGIKIKLKVKNILVKGTPQRCRLLKRKSTSLPWRPRQPGENDFLGKIVRISEFLVKV